MPAWREFEGDAPHVQPVDAHGAAEHVVQPGDQVGDGRLASARGSDEGDQLAGRGAERDVGEHRRGGKLLEHGNGLQRGERDVLGVRIGEVHVVEVDRRRATCQRDRIRSFRDHRGEVEHLEHPVEGDQSGHHIDVGVGELGEWAVETVQVSRHGDEGTDLESVIEGEQPSPSIHESRGERGGDGERHEEHAGVDGLDDGDVPDPSRSRREDRVAQKQGEGQEEIRVQEEERQAEHERRRKIKRNDPYI